MDTVSVRCNHCGAPLQIGADTRFVTCQFCHSQLEVRRTDSSVFTEQAAQIAESTVKMAENLKIIELQNQIEQLDRDLGDGPAARKRVGAGAQVFQIAFGIFWVSVVLMMAGASSSIGPGRGLAVIPILMAVFGIVVIGSSLRRTFSHNSRVDEYQRKRAELEQQIARLRQG